MGKRKTPVDPAPEAAPVAAVQEGGPELALEERVVAHCVALNLRRDPARDGEVVAVLPAGTPVVVDSTQWLSDGVGVWMAATALGQGGWVDARFLSQEEEG